MTQPSSRTNCFTGRARFVAAERHTARLSATRRNSDRFSEQVNAPIVPGKLYRARKTPDLFRPAAHGAAQKLSGAQARFSPQPASAPVHVATPPGSSIDNH